MAGNFQKLMLGTKPQIQKAQSMKQEKCFLKNYIQAHLFQTIEKSNIKSNSEKRGKNRGTQLRITTDFSDTMKARRVGWNS